MVEHPLRILFQKHRLTPTSWSRLVGVAIQDVSQVLSGVRTRIPRRWTPVLQALGIDYDEFNQAYVAWRVYHRDQILQELQRSAME